MVETREPRQGRAIERRDALLDAAAGLLAESGTQAVTHRAVAERAGSSHGSTRYYFTSRDQLLAATIERIATAQTDAAASALGQGRDRDEAVEQLVRFVVDELAADRDGAIVRYELFLEAARSPALREVLEEWGDRYRELLARTLFPGRPDAEVAAGVLLDVINGLLLGQLADPGADFEGSVLRPCLDIFLAEP